MNFARQRQPKQPLMENLNHIDLPGLIDLLAEETTRYMKLVNNGATKEEFEQCQQKMKMIQTEIEIRKRRESALM